MIALLGLWRYGLIACLLAAAGVWHLADKSRAVDDAVEQVRNEYITAALVASEAARAKESAWQTQLQKAQNEATTRQKTLAADAAALRTERDGLRDQLATAGRHLPGLTRPALERYTNTFGDVFAECVREYSGLAEAADRLASDRQTLIQSWPEN